MAGKRIAVVTGANKGIGFGIMKELCSKFDGIVYLTARDEGRGVEAIKKLSELGHSARFHQLDIDNQESIDKFANYIKTTYGGFDVLVNNAGFAYKVSVSVESNAADSGKSHNNHPGMLRSPQYAENSNSSCGTSQRRPCRSADK